ncbi:MAG: hypothetical protein JWM10_5064, partial [Myxococcaceae bacterium]|nr:hypothetical protein [Myxococcaceae bacterium]
MEHRRGLGLGSTVLALLLGAAGAGCSSGDTPTAADTGVADVGKSDGSLVEDTGAMGDGGSDAGGTDTGGNTDAGGGLDASDGGA